MLITAFNKTDSGLIVSTTEGILATVMSGKSRPEVRTNPGGLPEALSLGAPSIPCDFFLEVFPAPGIVSTLRAVAFCQVSCRRLVSRRDRA